MAQWESKYQEEAHILGKPEGESGEQAGNGCGVVQLRQGHPDAGAAA